MKIRRQYLVGRFVNPATNRPVNIHKGFNDRGFDVYYYISFKKGRVFVPETFRSWAKAEGRKIT